MGSLGGRIYPSVDGQCPRPWAENSTHTCMERTGVWTVALWVAMLTSLNRWCGGLGPTQQDTRASGWRRLQCSVNLSCSGLHSGLGSGMLNIEAHVAAHGAAAGQKRPVLSSAIWLFGFCKALYHVTVLPKQPDMGGACMVPTELRGKEAPEGRLGQEREAGWAFVCCL